jgi:hypothetical protein
MSCEIPERLSGELIGLVYCDNVICYGTFVLRICERNTRTSPATFHIISRPGPSLPTTWSTVSNFGKRNINFGFRKMTVENRETAFKIGDVDGRLAGTESRRQISLCNILLPCNTSQIPFPSLPIRFIVREGNKGINIVDGTDPAI